MTTLLSLHGLVKRFGGLVATDHANLDVRAGEIHALIGPNGAGKTTLIHQLSGGLAPDAGRVVFDGDDITTLPMQRRVARGLARSFQVTNVFTRLSVQDNLALAVPSRNGGAGHWWRGARADASRYQAGAEVAVRVGLGARLADLAGALAHGEQRQLEVGLALATRPRLLLLDEPLAGMGPAESERMVQLLHGLRGTVTLLLVEHDMDAVFRLADRVSVLVAGKMIATGAPADIRADPQVRQAYLGDEVDLGDLAHAGGEPAR